MNCNHCSAPLPDDSEFCPLCGTRVTVGVGVGAYAAPGYHTAYPGVSSTYKSVPSQPEAGRETVWEKAVNTAALFILAVLILALGIYSWTFLVVVLPSVGILLLIMRVGFKMRGSNYVIAFVTGLHALFYLVCAFIVFIASRSGSNYFSELMSDYLIVLIAAMLLCAIQIVLGFSLYVKKNNNRLIALLIIESVFLLANVLSCFGFDNSFTVIVLILWHILAVVLIANSLIITKKSKALYRDSREAEILNGSNPLPTDIQSQEDYARRNRILNSQRLFDSDYGLSAENPISAASVKDMGCYLAALRTEGGMPFTWVRKAANIPCFEGYADAYTLVLDGAEYKTVYINHSGLSTQHVPQGFAFNADAYGAAVKEMHYT